jgi:hypothetical protein
MSLLDLYLASPSRAKRLSSFIVEAQQFSQAEAHNALDHDFLMDHFVAGGTRHQYPVNLAEYVPIMVMR